jgi:hypothetical protein
VRRTRADWGRSAACGRQPDVPSCVIVHSSGHGRGAPGVRNGLQPIPRLVPSRIVVADGHHEVVGADLPATHAGAVAVVGPLGGLGIAVAANPPARHQNWQATFEAGQSSRPSTWAETSHAVDHGGRLLVVQPWVDVVAFTFEQIW